MTEMIHPLAVGISYKLKKVKLIFKNLQDRNQLCLACHVCSLSKAFTSSSRKTHRSLKTKLDFAGRFQSFHMALFSNVAFWCPARPPGTRSGLVYAAGKWPTGHVAA